MTDQWTSAPGCSSNGLPPANNWTPASGCSQPPGAPSIVGSIIVTDVPATIVAPLAWGITLNDGSAPPNFTIDHFDSTGTLIDSPIVIDGTSGDVTVTHDPTQPLGVATKNYVDSHSAGVTEAPEDGQLYGRSNADWVVIPEPTVPEAPNDGQAYVRQALAWAPLSAQLAGYLPLTGGALTGPLSATVASGLTPLTLNGPSGSWRSILGQTNGVNRWQMYVGDFGGELGSNAGSNFRLSSYTDAGAALASPLVIARQTGVATFSALPSFPGGAAGNVLSTNGAGALSWIAPSGGGISDAPNDGTAYARKSAGWANLSHMDITDWTATLAPYALTTSVPVAATTLPLASGVAAVGTSTAYARADHVHPTTSIGENRIINGAFAVNQRAYVSGTALAAAAYGHDRWKAGTGGCTYTFTAAVPDTTVTITAGTLTQVIEAGMIEGGVYTLSWTGTAQARVYQGSPSGSYAASPITTASLVAGTNTIIEFNTGTLVRAKLEIGGVATPFPRQSMAKSLADCQRYYQTGQFYHVNAASMGVNSNIAYSSLPTVTMRATPTMTIISNSSTNLSSVSLNANINMFTVGGQITAAGGGTFNVVFSANAEL